MMEVDHIISKDVFDGPNGDRARQMYGLEELKSVDDPLNLVPVYKPLNRQKWGRWLPDAEVRLRSEDYEKMRIPPPLGAEGEGAWSLGTLLHRGIAAARRVHPHLVAHLARVAAGEEEPRVGRLSPARENQLHTLASHSGVFPTISPYEVDGRVRGSLPSVEAMLYLPKHPGQQGYGWIRFSRAELERVRISPTHTAWVELLRPRAEGVRRAHPGDDADTSFGWVDLALTEVERSELTSLLASLRKFYLEAVSRVEDSLLRASAFPYGTRGYRLAELPYEDWTSLMGQAAIGLSGEGPRGAWYLNRTSNTAFTVESRPGAGERTVTRALFTSAWVEDPVSPHDRSSTARLVGLEWHPSPPQAQRIRDQTEDLTLAPLWTATEAHAWLFGEFAPRFFVPAPLASPPRGSGLLKLFPRGRLNSSAAHSRKGTLRSVKYPLGSMYGVGALVSYAAYRRTLLSLASDMAPTPGYLRAEHEIGLLQHVLWCLERFPRERERHWVYARLAGERFETAEDGVRAAMRDAAKNEVNAARMQFTLGTLVNLLDAKPAAVSEEEVLANASVHLRRLFVAAAEGELWRRMASRPW